MQYCAVDLSSFYLDVLKDRLYCDAADGPRRRSAQTVLHRIARDLPTLLAPVLPFTADEVWALIPGVRGRPCTWRSSRSAEPADEALLGALADAARGARGGHEGARGGARGEADRFEPGGRRSR